MLQQWFSKSNMHQNYSVSNTSAIFPGDVDTAGLGTTLRTTFLEYLLASALLQFGQFLRWAQW